MRKNKGFTLIEMLVVIAIIAIMVAIVVPTVSKATKRAKAATDAANLRSIYAQANSIVSFDNEGVASLAISNDNVKSAMYPDAEMFIAYSYPGFIYIFYYYDSQYYDLDYFAEIASSGESEKDTSAPSVEVTDELKYYNVTAKTWSSPGA